MLIKPLLLSQFSNLGAGDAFVVAIIPLADVLGNLNARTASTDWEVFFSWAMGRPWKMLEAQVQQLESALGSFARGDKAVRK